jgi:hypothetical protein
MAFKIDYYPDELIDQTKEDAVAKYNEFYWMNLNPVNIKIHTMKNRETMDQVQWRKTDNWNRAVTRWNYIYLFDLDILAEATWWVHKKDLWNYTRSIRHEVAHTFFRTYTNWSKFNITRLNEGMSIYLSGQLVEKRKPVKIENCLEFRDTIWDAVYNESGFVIELLINKYGKDKILELIKSAGKISSKEEFFEKFKEIYGFELSYETINVDLK